MAPQRDREFRLGRDVQLEVRKLGTNWELKWTIKGPQAIDGLTLVLPTSADDRKPQWRWSSRTKTPATLGKMDSPAYALALGPLAPGNHTLVISDL